MEAMGHILVFIWFALSILIGTIMFRRVHYIYFGDVIKGMFSAWLGWVIGTGFVLGLIGMMVFTAVAAIIEFIITHYLHIIGIIIIFTGIALWTGLFESVNEQTKDDKANNKKRRRNGIVVCCLGLIILGGGIMKNDNVKEVVNMNNSVNEQNESTSKVSTSTTEKKVDESVIIKAQQLLEKNKIAGTVLATSLGNDKNGFVSIIKKNNNYSFIILDQKNNQVAEIPFGLKEYYVNKQISNKSIDPLIFNMTIFDDKHDRDEKNGEWHGGNHIIPIFAAYKFDSKGNLIPGMLTSGAGAKPSHYQAYLNEQKNVDIVNLFLTEMKALTENAVMNKADIPRN